MPAEHLTPLSTGTAVIMVRKGLGKSYFSIIFIMMGRQGCQKQLQLELCFDILWSLERWLLALPTCVAASEGGSHPHTCTEPSEGGCTTGLRLNRS